MNKTIQILNQSKTLRNQTKLDSPVTGHSNCKISLTIFWLRFIKILQIGHLRSHDFIQYKILCSFIYLQENHTAKVNSNLVLSCLNEAGKSSLFCSLDSLNQISTQPRFFKKNPALRKLSADPSVSVAVGESY